MKYLALIILLFPSLAYAQEAPRKTNLIKVSGVSFRQVAEALLDQGYTFQKIDSNFNTITTEPKDYSLKVGGKIQLNIRVKDSTAFVTGYCGLTNGDFDNSGNKFSDAITGKAEIINSGMKGSLYKESFQTMDKFAKSLGGKIEYLKVE